MDTKTRQWSIPQKLKKTFSEHAITTACFTPPSIDIKENSMTSVFLGLALGTLMSQTDPITPSHIDRVTNKIHYLSSINIISLREAEHTKKILLEAGDYVYKNHMTLTVPNTTKTQNSNQAPFTKLEIAC